MSFRAFERALLKRGFRKITRPEFVAEFARLDLRAPSPRTGSEAGFVFTAKGLTVVVWTSFFEALGRARDSDQGWVLIREKDERKYVSPAAQAYGEFSLSPARTGSDRTRTCTPSPTMSSLQEIYGNQHREGSSVPVLVVCET